LAVKWAPCQRRLSLYVKWAIMPEMATTAWLMSLNPRTLPKDIKPKFTFPFHPCHGKPMRILIFGAGAVGQALGCMLAAAGERVSLVLRPRFLEAIRRQGLSVTGIFGSYHVSAHDISLYLAVSDIPRDSRFDYIIITAKAYDTLRAAEALSMLPDQHFVAISMQNGCGNLETILPFFGEQRSLAARVITGFEITEPSLVAITVTADAVQIGGNEDGTVPESAERLAAAIDRAGLPCRSTPHVRRHLFAKLLYNCALNPLGAILGVHYGALGESPETREIMKRVITETFAVIEAMQAGTLWQTPEQYLAFFYEKQIPATFNHRPSMLQDLEAGKRTEVEALTGYVSRKGKEFDIATPVCDTLSALIRFREAQPRQ
jgi:2-dehydropantoate 2-reductase